ncbi:hypothetical protein A2U01_0093740, partial [Trifolium medium]|nr:hypothetical protein [Trifolium medium]
GSKTKSGGVIVPDPEKEGPGPPEGVRVGDIVVKLGARQERVARKEGQKKGDGQISKESDMPADA